jgi:hypothetical protein
MKESFVDTAWSPDLAASFFACTFSLSLFSGFPKSAVKFFQMVLNSSSTVALTSSLFETSLDCQYNKIRSYTYPSSLSPTGTSVS